MEHFIIQSRTDRLLAALAVASDPDEMRRLRLLLKDEHLRSAEFWAAIS